MVDDVCCTRTVAFFSNYNTKKLGAILKVRY